MYAENQDLLGRESTSLMWVCLISGLVETFWCHQMLQKSTASLKRYVLYVVASSIAVLMLKTSLSRLLQEFVEKCKDDLEVVYTVAGWLNKVPPTYHITLVPGPKLAEAKHDFDGNCSIQVYSVQACIPKDPVAIWNAEFIQAEELFKQPITEDNCLRDNRFCGVLNTFVKRNAEGECVAVTMPQTKSAGIPSPALDSPANQSGSVMQPQQKKLEEASLKSALQSSSMTTSRTKPDRSGVYDVQSKESDKDNKASLPIKRKGQSDKNSAGIGSSLANLWGRASSKPKSTNSADEEKLAASKTDGASDSVHSQIIARENTEAASSDDDESDVNFKRASNDGGKKRRVVFDDSDEEDEEISVDLGSPDIPNGKLNQDLRQKSRTPDTEKSIRKVDEQEECKPIVKEENSIDDSSHYAKEEFAALYMGKNVRVSNSEGIHGNTPHVDSNTINKNKTADAAPSSPKRRKVLKTRIDERGREVAEVVWESEETNVKDTNATKSSSEPPKNSIGHTEKAEEKVSANVTNRAATNKKSPATGSTAPSHAAGKGGGKKERIQRMLSKETYYPSSRKYD
ncbi:DNA polymerase delta subunit 3 [Bienertia sinuspersici]